MGRWTFWVLSLTVPRKRFDLYAGLAKVHIEFGRIAFRELDSMFGRINTTTRLRVRVGSFPSSKVTSVEFAGRGLKQLQVRSLFHRMAHTWVSSSRVMV